MWGLTSQPWDQESHAVPTEAARRLSLSFDFRGKTFSLSWLTLILAVVFHTSLISSSGGFHLFLVFKVFLFQGMLDSIKLLSASIEMIMWFLYFILLIWGITLIDFWMLSQPCIAGIHSTWSWYIILFVCCWIQFVILFICCLFLRFWKYIPKKSWSVVFLWYLCLVLV